ncbi:MAG: hypothetical protein WCK48_02155 [bacterium]
MNFINNTSKKIILTVLCCFLILFTFPIKSHALLGAGDVSFDPPQEVEGGLTTITTGVDAGINTVNTGLSFAQYAKSFVLDTLANAVAKQIIRKLTAQTVNWINSGFKGNPAYVTNPESFFLNVGDNVAAKFLSGNGTLSSLCSPFQAQIRLALVKNYLQETDTRGYSCTLGKIEQNFDNFTNNFDNGGWESWFQVTQNNQNNPYGAYLEAKNSLSAQIGTQNKKYSEQITQGRGFLSWETCDNSDEDSGGQTTTGSKRTVCLKGVVGTGINGVEISYPAPDYGPVGPSCTQSDIQVYTGSKWVSQGSLSTGNSRVDTSSNNSVLADCPNGKTQVNTPGSVIESQLENTFGSSIRQLELTQSINQVVSALMTQLVQQVVGGIGKGVRGLTQSSPSQPSSLIQQMTAGSVQSKAEDQNVLNTVTTVKQETMPTAPSTQLDIPSKAEMKDTMQKERDSTTLPPPTNGSIPVIPVN